MTLGEFRRHTIKKIWRARESGNWAIYGSSGNSVAELVEVPAFRPGSGLSSPRKIRDQWNSASALVALQIIFPMTTLIPSQKIFEI